MTTVVWVHQHKLLIKKMPHRLAYSDQWNGAISSGELPFYLDDFSLCQDDQRLRNTTMKLYPKSAPKEQMNYFEVYDQTMMPN